MFRQLLMRASRAILRLARTIAHGFAEGTMPSPMSPTAQDENIAWGTKWVTAVATSLIVGETVHVTRVDAVMLVLFLASIIAARRGMPRPSIVYQAALTT